MTIEFELNGFTHRVDLDDVTQIDDQLLSELSMLGYTNIREVVEC